MSVAELCTQLGWNATDLSRQAGINYQTARNAYDGQPPTERIKRQICEAFTRGLGRTVLPGEVAWEVRHI